MDQDVGPKGTFDASGVPDAIPVWEPLSRQGNKSPYRVRGVDYSLVDVSNGFEQIGIASWYGLKFHGELTSNGELYNMYAMSAAHKRLPIPSFVRVTNLENNRQVVVRINDRGPFHKGRVIDLSYAAATKLGYAKKGTAKVKVELIQPEPPGMTNASLTSGGADKIVHFIQIAAYSLIESAESTLEQMQSMEDLPEIFIASQFASGNAIHRVRVGPFKDQVAAEFALKKLKRRGFSGAMVIQRALSAKNI